MNLIKNKKGVVNLIAYIFYILLALSVLAIVISGSLNIIEKNKQKNNYELMLKTIDSLDKKIQEVSNNRFQRQEVIVNNPEELTIDCENNKIIGSVVYGSNFRTDQNVNVNNIILYKKLGKVFFEKEINNSNNLINLNCNNLNLKQGKNTITVSYFDYNSQTEKIQIDIVPKRERTNNWYNSNWEYRQLLIIDSNYVSGTVTNFPVPISLTSLALKQKGKSDGSDVVFTSADGFTKLSREIEDYNSESGELIAFVKIPGDLDGNKNTNIYMYYGNENGTETNDTQTWDDDFLMVLHFNDSFDSTNNNNDIVNNVNNAVFTKVNNRNCVVLDSSKNQYLVVNNSESLNTLENVTISSVNYFNELDYSTNTGKLISIFLKGQPDSPNPHTGIWFKYDNRNNGNRFKYTCFGDTEGGYAGGGNNFSGNEYNTNFTEYTENQIAFTISNNYGRLYVNGEQKYNPKLFSNLALSNTTNVTIGSSLTGAICELRISKIARSDDWIKTEYNTINNIEKLITVGEIEIR
ncbi:MAG: DUF2341 domain-containing protein [archaeon]|jgi:hypothetical protein|nr:DUF2341 domain-containing protein [archaeon]MDD2477515.1 DUF2341 domain-containing protein [Candidatus ainarchaeum sp.]MDD3084814.1 DUF2341 domain-containing protein [Candidatus ainarchaeum sp.]